MIERIDEDIKQAMLANDGLRVSVLRGIKSAIVNARIANKGKDLSNSDVIKVIKSEAKKRNEAIEVYKKSEDRVRQEKEEKELSIINEYLPQQLSEEEVEKIVIDTINSTGASGSKDKGRLIGEVMKLHGDKVDGSMVATVISRLLK